MKYLANVTEVYRVETDREAETLIAEAKEDRRFILSKYKCDKKEIKSKGEVIDEYFVLTLTKVFNDIKEPYVNVNINYEVE